MQLVRCDKCGKEISKGSIAIIAKANHGDPLAPNIFMGDMCSTCFTLFTKEMKLKRENETNDNHCWCDPTRITTEEKATGRVKHREKKNKSAKGNMRKEKTEKQN